MNLIAEFDFARDDNERAKIFYASFGFAGYWIQCLEQTFENMIIVGTFHNKENISTEFVDSFYEQLEKSKDTMGKLLKKVKEIYSISEQHIEELSNILEIRNYMIHRFFKTNNMKLYTKEGQREMIIEFDDFVRRIKVIDSELNSYFVGYLSSFGITLEGLKVILESKKNEEIERRRNESSH